MIRITYHGHSCIELNDGTTDILFDPFITGNPVTAAVVEGLNPDYILVSHGHADHLGDAIELSKRTGATIVSPFELANFCALRGATVHAMHIGGSFNFPFGRLRLTQALHGSAYVCETETHYTGNPCGFVVSIGAQTFYFAGDTGLFSDMKMIGERNSIDAAFLPIGDNFTMGPEDAVTAAVWLGTKMVIPIHYNTWPIIETEPADFQRLCDAAGITCVVLPFNESCNLES